MLEDDDEGPVEAGDDDDSGPLVEARRSVGSGDYARARALLESLDRRVGERARVDYIALLYRLDDQPAFQAAVSDAVMSIGSQSAASDTYLLFLLEKAERACLDASLIATLLGEMARRVTSPAIQAAYRGARPRQDFRMLRAPRAAGATLVPLGLNCLSWTLFNRWGLRRAGHMAGDYNPFCLAVHKMEGVIGALRNDFATYADPSQMASVTSMTGQTLVMSRDRAAIWNHNKSAYWTADGFAPLAANLRMKIANFRRTCRSGTPVFVVTKCPDHYPRENLAFLPRLQEALRAATGRAENHLLLTSQIGEDGPDSVLDVDPYTKYFNCNFPDRGYKWHRRDHYNSDAGLAFEARFLALLFECLESWSLLDGAADVMGVDRSTSGHEEALSAR